MDVLLTLHFNFYPNERYGKSFLLFYNLRYISASYFYNLLNNHTTSAGIYFSQTWYCCMPCMLTSSPMGDMVKAFVVLFVQQLEWVVEFSASYFNNLLHNATISACIYFSHCYMPCILTSSPMRDMMKAFYCFIWWANRMSGGKFCFILLQSVT